jgi:GT2 family glycosyltransferase
LFSSVHYTLPFVGELSKTREIWARGTLTLPTSHEEVLTQTERDVTVAILIVNWNSGGLLRECLESLRGQRRPPDRVIVVDNASTDDSLARASSSLTGTQLIRLPNNLGFAHANNVGAQAAEGFDGLALLNPDAIAEPGWLEALVDAAEGEPSVAAFASQMRFASDPRYLDGAGDSYHVAGRAWRNGHGTPTSAWPDGNVDVFAPCAAAALYRRNAFEEVRGFDDRFFCYFEDVDLGFRLRLAGHRCLYVHSAVVRHLSSALSGYRSDFAVYHGERNMIWTFVKDMPSPLFWWYLPQHVMLNFVSLAFYPWRGQGKIVARAKWDAVRGLGVVLQQRKIVQRTRVVNVQTLKQALSRGVLVPYARLAQDGNRSRTPNRAPKE